MTLPKLWVEEVGLKEGEKGGSDSWQGEKSADTTAKEAK